MSDAASRLKAVLVLGFGLVASACGGGNGVVPNSGDGTGPDVAELVLQLSIGDDFAAAPEYQFSLIRSILIASDRTIRVADITEGAFGGLGRGTPLLRQFDAGGTFVRQVARQGDGPGEYRQPEGLVVLSDGRVAVRDLAPPGKVLLFTADGQFSETWTANSLGQDVMRYTSNTNSALRIDAGGILWVPVRAMAIGSPSRFLRIRPDGTVLDVVDRPSLPAVERPATRMTRYGGRAVMGLSAPYLPRAISAWSPEGTFAVGQTDQYRIEVLPPPPYGAATRVIEHEVPVLPVPRAEREAHRNRMEDQMAAFNPDNSIQVPDIPDTKPPIRSIRFTDDGQLLVTVHMPSRLQDGEWTEDRAFDVFDTEGALRGRVVLPDSFRYMGMRGDTMWGVFRDELDVQSVRVYSVSWP